MSSGTSRRGPYRKDKMRYEPQSAVNTGGAFAGGRGRGHGDEQRQRPVAIDDERWHHDGRQQRVVFFVSWCVERQQRLHHAGKTTLRLAWFPGA